MLDLIATGLGGGLLSGAGVWAWFTRQPKIPVVEAGRVSELAGSIDAMAVELKQRPLELQAERDQNVKMLRSILAELSERPIVVTAKVGAENPLILAKLLDADENNILATFPLEARHRRPTMVYEGTRFKLSHTEPGLAVYRKHA